MHVKILLITLILIYMNTSMARDDIGNWPFKEAIERGINEGVLDGSVTFYLDGNPHPKIVKNHGEYRSNKKTNAVGKSDQKACQWALLSALKSFQQRAQSLGANAVVNIKSNYKNNTYSHPTEYQCGAGAIMAGVALKADVVKLEAVD